MNITLFNLSKLCLFFLLFTPRVLLGQITEEYGLEVLKNERERDLIHLLKAKDLIVNGDIQKARFFLDKIDGQKGKLAPIKARYLGLIEFIEGNYQKTVDILSHSYFNSESQYNDICQLKVFALMALPEKKDELTDKLSREWSQCKIHTSRFSLTNHLWADSLIQLIKGNAQVRGGGLYQKKFLLDHPEYLRVWAKLILYLGHEQAALRSILDLPFEAYESKRMREIIGLIYYRADKPAQALEMIEDINSVNAENIKGHLALKEQNYTKAFEHYKLALKGQHNSQNALEKLIPLAWILGELEVGHYFQHFLKTSSMAKKKALELAFSVRMKNFKKAETLFLELIHLSKGEIPRELKILATYLKANTAEFKDLKKYSYESCVNHSSISCWAYYSALSFPDLTKTIQREDSTLGGDTSFSLEKLKGPQSLSPLVEPLFVDQKDIDELDSNDVVLEF